MRRALLGLTAAAIAADSPRRLIVVSFQQAAVDRFHELAPNIDVAPGIDGTANYLLAGGRRARASSRSRFRSPSPPAARRCR